MIITKLMIDLLQLMNADTMKITFAKILLFFKSKTKSLLKLMCNILKVITCLIKGWY